MTRRRLCHLSDIPDGTAKGFTIDGGDGPRDIFVHRSGNRVRGYLNSCPHVGSPLDWAPDRFIAFDGYHILCGTHGAMFRPEDGYCVSGPCAGDSLTPVAVTLSGDDVVFGD